MQNLNRQGVAICPGIYVYINFHENAKIKSAGGGHLPRDLFLLKIRCKLKAKIKSAGGCHLSRDLYVYIKFHEKMPTLNRQGGCHLPRDLCLQKISWTLNAKTNSVRGGLSPDLTARPARSRY